MLNQKDKFERFAQVINKNADDKCEQINGQAQSVLKQQLSEIEYMAALELDRRLEAESKKTQIEINRKISCIEAECRKQIALHREKITEKVFSQVSEKLEVFCDSEEYNGYLERSICKLRDTLEEGFTVYVRPKDAERVKALTQNKPYVLGVEADSTIVSGGIIAANADNSIRVDNTIDCELEGMKEWFKANSLLTV